MLTRFDWCTLTSGGWPRLPFVPSRSGTVGALLLRSVQGGCDAAGTMGVVMPSGLHRTYGAHHLHFITCSCYRRLPFMSTARSRDLFLSTLEQMRALSVRGCGVCRYENRGQTERSPVFRRVGIGKRSDVSSLPGNRKWISCRFSDSRTTI